MGDKLLRDGLLQLRIMSDRGGLRKLTALNGRVQLPESLSNVHKQNFSTILLSVYLSFRKMPQEVKAISSVIQIRCYCSVHNNELEATAIKIYSSW